MAAGYFGFGWVPGDMVLWLWLGAWCVNQASLVGPPIPCHETAKVHSGDHGLITEINSATSTCKIDFQTSEAWLPLASCVYVPDAALWKRWLEEQEAVQVFPCACPLPVTPSPLPVARLTLATSPGYGTAPRADPRVLSSACAGVVQQW